MKKIILIIALIAGFSVSAQEDCYEVRRVADFWQSQVGKNGIRMAQYNCNTRSVVIHQNATSSNNHWVGSKAFKWGYLSNPNSYHKMMYNNRINEKYIWYWNNEKVYEFIIEYDEFD